MSFSFMCIAKFLTYVNKQQSMSKQLCSSMWWTPIITPNACMPDIDQKRKKNLMLCIFWLYT